MNHRIRDFVPSDWDAYLAMSRAFYASPAVLHAVPEDCFRATFDQCVKGSPYVRGLALLMGEAVAGYALVVMSWSCEAGGPCIILDEAYVLPEYQGQGLGSAFLRFVEAEYAGSAKRLRLEVTAENQGAIRLYERMGYTEYNYKQMIKDL